MLVPIHCYFVSLAGVQSIVVFGLDIRSSEQALKLAESYPGYIYVAIGKAEFNNI